MPLPLVPCTAQEDFDIPIQPRRIRYVEVNERVMYLTSGAAFEHAAEDGRIRELSDDTFQAAAVFPSKHEKGPSSCIMVVKPEGPANILPHDGDPPGPI